MLIYLGLAPNSKFDSQNIPQTCLKHFFRFRSAHGKVVVLLVLLLRTRRPLPVRSSGLKPSWGEGDSRSTPETRPQMLWTQRENLALAYVIAGILDVRYVCGWCALFILGRLEIDSRSTLVKKKPQKIGFPKRF